MTTELYWLTLTALMTALFWVPYVLNRLAMNGLLGTLAGSAPDSSSLSIWAQRAIKAHYNAVELVNHSLHFPVQLGWFWNFIFLVIISMCRDAIPVFMP